MTPQDLFDRGAPMDLKAERLLASVALVADAGLRREIVFSLAPEAFHDEFYRWLWAAMRCYTQGRHRELLRRIYEHPRPDWFRGHLGYWLATLLVSRSGRLIAGNVKLWRLYRDRLNQHHKMRTAIDEGYEFIRRQWNAFDDLQCGFRHT